MTGEGAEDGVEVAALPAPSSDGRAQRSGEMAIISRDGRKFRPRERGEFVPAEASTEDPL